MPQPEGQSCENCQFFFPFATTTPRSGDGTCQVVQPGAGVRFGDWPAINKTYWCGRWAGSSGSSGIASTDVGAGYRGTDPVGDIVALDPAFTRLDPSFAAITDTLNFTFTSPGVITLNYTTYTPSPTFEIYVTVMGVVVLRSLTNNQSLSVTIGKNGTANPVYAVPADVKTAGEAVPIPVAAGLSMKNGDTVSFFARDNVPGNADLISYHMLLEGFRVITY